MRLLQVLFVFFSGMLFSMSLLAETAAEVGRMIWVNGPAQAISPSHATRSLQRRSPIYEQDTIVTGDSGTGQIVFTDNSVVVLRASTTFRIDQYKFNPSLPNDGKYIASVAKGGFRTITGLISKGNPDGYQVNTPVATIGVRGTDYSIFYMPCNPRKGKTAKTDPTCSRGLVVKLSRGKIVVVNPQGQVELNASKGGTFAVVKSLEQPPAITNNQSTLFDSQPSISSGPGGKFGPTTKSVSGFCIN